MELARLATSLNRMTTRLLESRHGGAARKWRASDLAAGIAHEIAIVGAINGTPISSDVACAQDGLDDELAAIERETARIDRSCAPSRLCAPPRRGRRPSPSRSMSVSTRRDDASRSGRTQAGEGVRRDPSGVPALSGDRHDLEQALVNLLLTRSTP